MITRRSLLFPCCTATLATPAFAADPAPSPLPQLAASHPTTLPTLSSRGQATLDLINRYLHPPTFPYYFQNAKPSDPPHHAGPANNWAMGVQLSALNAAARVDRARYLPAVKECADPFDLFWIEANGTGGYSGSIRPSEPDRYYDDNAWIVLGCWRRTT